MTGKPFAHETEPCIRLGELATVRTLVLQKYKGANHAVNEEILAFLQGG